MMSTTFYGPGDEITWGPFFGHPNDPRQPEYDDDFEWPEDGEESEEDVCID